MKQRSKTFIAVSVVVVAAVLFLVGWVGWVLHSPAHRDVKVENSFVGTITNLNIDHNSGCLQGSGQHVCGAILSFDPKPLHQGSSVRVVRETYTDSAGNGTLLLVVVPTSSQVG